jgi:hypothetical protein
LFWTCPDTRIKVATTPGAEVNSVPGFSSRTPSNTNPPVSWIRQFLIVTGTG